MQAIGSTAGMLSPLSADEFFRNDWTRNVRHVSGEAAKWSAVFNAIDFCKIAQDLSLQPPQELGLYRLGLSYQAELETFRSKVQAEEPQSISDLASLCPKACTLFIRNISRFHSGLDHFAFSLFNELRERVHINAYLSPAASDPGLGSHYDCWDIFILQIAGSKQWTLYDGGQTFPVAKFGFNDPDGQQGDISDEIVLKEGGLLYLPRGKWHRAAATHEPSLHLTIGVHCKNGLTFVDWLERQVESVEMFRQNLPLQRVPQTESISDRFDAILAKMHEMLNDENLLRRFLIDRFKQEYFEMAQGGVNKSWDDSRSGEAGLQDLTFFTRLRWHPLCSVRHAKAVTVIILNGQVISLEHVGARIWALFENGTCLQAAAEVVACEFNTELGQTLPDVQQFVRSMVEGKFLVQCGDSLRGSDRAGAQ